MSAVGEGDAGAGVAEGGANRFGRLSELRIVARRSKGQAGSPRTELADVYFSMPLKVMKPFWPGDLGEEGAGGAVCPPGLMRVMTMSTSAGTMAGDDQRIDVDVACGAALEVTNQAFEKIHRMEEGGSARRVTHLRVGRGAFLRYTPQPTIPFAGSAFSSTTFVTLEDATSRLVYGEILSAGRVARGECFAFSSYGNRVEVRCAGSPVYIDNTLYQPGPSGMLPGMGLADLGFFEGFTHLSNLLLVNMGLGARDVDRLRDHLHELCGQEEPGGIGEVAGGITELASGDHVVRLLGRNAQRLQRIQEELLGLL